MARHPYTRKLNVSLEPRKPLGEGEEPWFVYSKSPRDGDVNSHKPWSAMDMADLKLAIKDGWMLSETASFLCRAQYEVRDRAKELGFEFG
jgi:hypothetical protein